MEKIVAEPIIYEQMTCFLPKVRQMTEEEKREYEEMIRDSKQLSLDEFLSI